MASGSELSPGLAELPAAALPPSARVHLAHAVLQGIATETGLRMLHIKGPALLPGLRVAHHGSTDADVLLPPEEFPRFEDALQSRGWDRRSHLGSGSAFEHATIWWHPDWGYADVHARWPGVTIGDAEAFAILAEEAFDLEIAHVPCLVPGRTAQIVILLLHAARSAGNNDVELAWQSQSAAQQDLVRQLVSRVGAEVALAAALGELEEHRADPSYQLWKYYREGGPRLIEWRARMAAATTWRARLRVARSAVAVNEDHLAMQLGHPPSAAELRRARATRITTLLRELAATLRPGRGKSD